jgi:hypothetical protein
MTDATSASRVPVCGRQPDNTVSDASREDYIAASQRAPVDADAAKRALDELFINARQYRSADKFHRLMTFVRNFRFYSPFNAVLVHVQMPGAKYVATASRWRREYHRVLLPAARPLAILQPMGPVMYVFDVSDTEPEDKAPPLPREVTDPFEVRGGRVGQQLEQTIHNAARDGVQVIARQAGSQSAGMLQVATRKQTIPFEIRGRGGMETHQVALQFELLLNAMHSREARYATLTHELGHLYCGHLGSPDRRWWPDRRRMSRVELEFEAESVCYLACGRLGIDNPSDDYLSGYLANGTDVPLISLEYVLKAVSLVEQMGAEPMGLRKSKD